MVDIPNFSGETVQTAVELCYGRKIRSVSMNDKLEVLRFCHNFKIKGIKVSLIIVKSVRVSVILIETFQELVEISLIEDVSYSTVADIVNCAYVNDAIVLLLRCLNFLVASGRLSQSIGNYETILDSVKLQLVDRLF